VLRRLAIKNLAIVEDVELEFRPGLAVLTGETGAGKSILVDAVLLLAGGRGSSDLVRHGSERLVVAGEFEVDAPVRALLTEAGLPLGDAILIKRELTPEGRGRAFVEDEPAAIRTLVRLGERLVAVHGQNSEQELADRAAPLELLDAFAKAQPERDAVVEAAKKWSEALQALEALEASRRDRTRRLESLDFEIREIEAAEPREGEEEALLSDRGRLAHADRIRRAGETALAALSESEDSAADRLGEAARAFAELASIDPRESAHAEEAEELKRRIADLAAAARDAAEAIEAEPDRLTQLETRLEKIARIKRKYGPSMPDVLSRLAAAKAERSELANIEDAMDRRQRDESQSRDLYRKAASALSAKRTSAAGRFSTAVEKELLGLAMEKARFRVALQNHAEESPRPDGLETAGFLFAPNPGEPEKPLERIASGGELSRLQLAIRSVAANRAGRAHTLVFDEVDAGIGGRVAEVVGKKLRDLARHDQVLCVTHVPQIAALADQHFLAEKQAVKGRTVARVRELSGKERIAEIARMLAGEKVPDTAMKHAQALLQAAGK
jgi:DNA repair protein RecN (Recombination protein N)